VSSKRDVVVFCEVGSALPRIRSQFPSVTPVDISEGVPPDVRGDVLFGGFNPHSAEAMERGVHWVQLTGTGVDGVPPQLLAAEVVTCARGASALAISEYVIATIGAFARGFPGNWITEVPARWNFQEATTLAGCTVGLYGLGGIAQRVARIALAMEMSVVALRRTAAPSPIEGVEVVTSMTDLVARTDHLVLAAPGTAHTRHVVNAQSIAGMKQGVHLVNIARGSLVDQDALRVGLDDGTIARASLDVTDPEPLPAGHWLYEHPKVFLTPHASWVGPPFLSVATDIFCDNLGRYLAGEPLRYEVNNEGY
jgi:phosphoglycerate dehydrogenase-like enzyme